MNIRGKVIHLHQADINKHFLCVRIYGIFFNNFLFLFSFAVYTSVTRFTVSVRFSFFCCYEEYVCCEHLLLSLHICYLFSSSLALKHIWRIIFWCRSFIHVFAYDFNTSSDQKKHQWRKQHQPKNNDTNCNSNGNASTNK